MQKSTFRLFLILLMVLTIAFVAKANPAEYLNNPTFTGDITGWTVAYDVQGTGSIAYDGTYYHGGTAGSLKGVTGVGKVSVMQGYAWQTIGTEINSDDVVKLSFQWSKRSIISISAGINTLKAEITKPLTPDIWEEIWRCDELLPPVDGATTWTGPSELDVSSYFDETGTYKFRWYFDLKSGNKNGAQALAWFDTASLDVSAGVSFSCSTIPSNIQFGTLTTGQVYTALVNTTTTVTAGAGGFTLSIYDSGDTVNPGLYNSTGTPTDIIGSADASFGDTATLSNGTEGYGIQVATTSAGSGTLTVASRYANKTGTDVGGLERGSGNAVEVASSTDAVTDREIVITYKAAISSLNAGGDYKDTITYTCIAN